MPSLSDVLIKPQPPTSAPGYSGPPMVNPNVPMTNFWGGVQGVGNPNQYAGGIPLVKAGSHYTRGIDMVKSGASYFNGMFMPQEGKHYFNDKTIDLVDKAGDYTGLEAEAGRTLARMGGALMADQYGGGLVGGGLGRAMQQSLVAETGGNLAQAINEDKFNRESMVQQGTLAKQQGVLAGDTAKSQADYQKRAGILQGDSARMQGQIARNNLELSGDSARQSGAIARNQLKLSAAQTNSSVSLAKAQGQAADQQFGLQLGYNYNQLNAGNWWNYQQNQLGREQLYAGNTQQPYYGNDGTGRK